MATYLAAPAKISNDQQISPPQSNIYICVVCGDESDGIHFGQYSCRACAAFFRRTVSLRLDYTCKAHGQCPIMKNARNMCRSCRFTKCLTTGMQPSSVQPARDALGKRKDPVKRSNGQWTPVSQPSTSDYGTDSTSPGQYSQDALPNNKAVGNGTYQVYTTANPVANTVGRKTSPVEECQTKYLQKMVTGYRNFCSLRRASYTLVDIIPRFADGDPDATPPSNYGSSKKVCRIEASLLMDMIMKSFDPFSTLSSSDRSRIFDTFYSHFSNAERAYTTYRVFGHFEDNDKLIMPDGGYVRISELEKFYDNSDVHAAPAEVAKVFSNIYNYIVRFIVNNMVRLEIDDYEIVTIFGLFLWRDTVTGVSAEAQQVIEAARDDLLRDLYSHYKHIGFVDSEITVRTGNLFMLIPKLEHSVKLVKENFDIAELFNMLEIDRCCKDFNDKS